MVTTNKSLTKLLKAYNKSKSKFITVQSLATATNYSESRIQKIVSLYPEKFSRVLNVNKSLGEVLNAFTYKSGYATISHIVRKTKYSPERVEKVLELNPHLFGKSFIKRGGVETFYMLRTEVSRLKDFWNTLVNFSTGQY